MIILSPCDVLHDLQELLLDAHQLMCLGAKLSASTLQLALVSLSFSS
jgi:hypothetical protein